MLGELMATPAVNRGLAGLVVQGPVRRSRVSRGLDAVTGAAPEGP